MPKSVDARVARHTEGVSGPLPTRRPELQTTRDTSAAKHQTGGHPHRLHGRHEGGLHVTEHHRKGRG